MDRPEDDIAGRVSTPLTRFLVTGAANTLATYALYLALLATLGHRWSYTCAFAAGIAIAYTLNRRFVFRTHAGWRSIVALPLIYLLQYGVGLAIVESWITWLVWPAAFAPLGAIAVTLPLTYLLSKKAFVA